MSKGFSAGILPGVEVTRTFLEIRRTVPVDDASSGRHHRGNDFGLVGWDVWKQAEQAVQAGSGVGCPMAFLPQQSKIGLPPQHPQIRRALRPPGLLGTPFARSGVGCPMALR